MNHRQHNHLSGLRRLAVLPALFILIICSVCGCGKQESTFSNDPVSKETESQKEPTDNGQQNNTGNPSDVSAIASNDMLKVYLDYQNYFINESGIVDGKCSDFQYSFIYLNDDDIPEFLVNYWSPSTGMQFAMMYYENGRVVEAGVGRYDTRAGNSAIDYYEEDGVFRYSHGMSGYWFTDVLKFNGSEIEPLHTFLEKNEDIKRYYVGGTEVSYDVYDKAQNDAFSNDKAASVIWYPSCVKAYRALTHTDKDSEIKDELDLYLAFEEAAEDTASDILSYAFVYLDDDSVPELCIRNNTDTDSGNTFFYSGKKITAGQFYFNYYYPKTGKACLMWHYSEMGGIRIGTLSNHQWSYTDVGDIWLSSHDSYGNPVYYATWNDLPISTSLYEELAEYSFDRHNAVQPVWYPTLFEAYCRINTDYDSESLSLHSQLDTIAAADKKLRPVKEAYEAYVVSEEALCNAYYKYIYIDGDDIPELFIQNKNDRCYLLTYDNGEVLCEAIPIAARFAGFSYIEKGGKYSFTNYAYPVYDVFVCSFDKGTTETKRVGSYHYEEDGTAIYHFNDKEVSQAEYQEKMSDYYGELSKTKSIYDYTSTLNGAYTALLVKG